MLQEQAVETLVSGISEANMLSTFAEYCSTNKLKYNVDNFITWDAAHNEGKLIKSFGTDEEMAKFGIRVKMSRLLTKYKPILIQSGRLVLSVKTATVDPAKAHAAALTRLGTALTKFKGEGVTFNEVITVGAKVFNLAVQ